MAKLLSNSELERRQPPTLGDRGHAEGTRDAEPARPLFESYFRLSRRASDSCKSLATDPMKRTVIYFSREARQSAELIGGIFRSKSSRGPNPLKASLRVALTPSHMPRVRPAERRRQELSSRWIV